MSAQNNDFSIAVLISGRGSNLRSLIEHAHHYRIMSVLSNQANVGGLQIAENAAIPTITHPRKKDRSHREHIYQDIAQLNPDLVVLAGFMEILDADFVHQWQGKLVNIHPSLLPNFRGLNTHQRALQQFSTSTGSDKQHGCSVHYVDVTVDTGPIIAQAACAIKQEDDEESLAARVLQDEHRLFPWVINTIAAGHIGYRDQVFYSELARAQAAEQQFILSC